MAEGLAVPRSLTVLVILTGVENTEMAIFVHVALFLFGSRFPARVMGCMAFDTLSTCVLDAV